MKRFAARVGWAVALAGAGTVAATSPAGVIGLQVDGLSPTLRVDSEEVELSRLAVRASYLLRSTLAHPRRTTLRVVMPTVAIDRDPERDEKPSRERRAGADGMAVSLRVNGRPLAPRREVRALLDGRDVTSTLHRLGVPAALGSDDDLPPNRATLRRLSAAGLVVGGRARWSYRATYEWTVSLPPGTTRIDLSYRPLLGRWPGTGMHAPDLDPGGPAAADYCADADLRRRFALQPPHYGALVVAHDWRVDTRQPQRIGRVRLRVDAGDPDTLVAFCPVVPRTRRGAVSEWEATDFTPAHPARALLLYRNDGIGPSGWSAGPSTR